MFKSPIEGVPDILRLGILGFVGDVGRGCGLCGRGGPVTNPSTEKPLTPQSHLSDAYKKIYFDMFNFSWSA